MRVHHISRRSRHESQLTACCHLAFRLHHCCATDKPARLFDRFFKFDEEILIDCYRQVKYRVPGMTGPLIQTTPVTHQTSKAMGPSTHQPEINDCEANNVCTITSVKLIFCLFGPKIGRCYTGNFFFFFMTIFNIQMAQTVSCLENDEVTSFQETTR